MSEPRLVGKEEVVEPIGNRVVEEGGDAKEPLGDEINPLDEHLEPEVVAEIDRGEVGDGKNERYGISYAHVASYPDVFEVVALLDVAERSITLPAGKVDFDDSPYVLFGLAEQRSL